MRYYRRYGKGLSYKKNVGTPDETQEVSEVCTLAYSVRVVSAKHAQASIAIL